MAEMFRRLIGLETARSAAIAAGFGLVLVAGTADLAAPAAAQQQSDTAAQPGDAQTPAKPWVVNCSNQAGADLTCVMSQTLMMAETRQRVLSASIVKVSDTGEVVMRLALPHGVHLPSGVRLRIDDGPETTYPIEVADQNGSYARIVLDRPLLDAMLHGSAIRVSLTVPSADKGLELQLSLIGFTAALDTLR